MIEINKKHVGCAFLNPASTIVSMWQYRDLINQLFQRNIEVRYRGTALGLIWMLVTPLVLLSVYTFVFGTIFKARWGQGGGDSQTAFSFILFCGMTIFNVFSESVNGSVNIVKENPNYVKKVVFPLELLPVSIVLSSFFYGLIWIIILLFGIGFFVHKISLAVICLPLVIIPLFLLSCGISWLVASLGVFLRDLSHIVGIILLMLNFLTPIFYSVEMVPVAFRSLLLLNPLAQIIHLARQVTIYNQWPDWGAMICVAVFSIIVFQLGYFWFMKTKRGFADVL